MCGIAGIISLDENVIDTNILEQFNTLLQDRGPENSGYVTDNMVSFCHTRLSIIDLSKGANQPLYASDNNLLITFNGEIYNYQELRDKFLKNCNLNTNSDTEVILELWKKFGTKTLEMLDGIYAFAIYEKNSGNVFVVRDRLGKKPLYYSEYKNKFIFASEIKAFSAIPGFNISLDYEAINYQFLFNYTPNLSPFNEVKMLPPGSYLKINLKEKSISQTRFFGISQLVDPVKYQKFSEMPEEKVIDHFDSLLNKAVAKRLIADVKVSSINSGGLDSSLISAIAIKNNAISDLYHISVDKASETYYAKLLAENKKVKLNSVEYNEKVFGEHFKRASELYEYFMVHPNSVGLYTLAKEMSRDGYKVVLGGEAADEIFGGYTNTQKLYEYYAKGQKLRNVPINYLYRIWCRYFKYFGLPVVPNQKNKILDYMNSDPRLNREINLIQKYETFFNHIKNSDERKYRAILLHDLTRYLQSLFLRGDKMFMGGSVELRLPFADVDLIADAMNLPMKYVREKYILKKIAERYLPKEIIYRGKMGFPMKYQFNHKISNDKLKYSGLNPENMISLQGLDIFIDKYFPQNNVQSYDSNNS